MSRSGTRGRKAPGTPLVRSVAHPILGETPSDTPGIDGSGLKSLSPKAGHNKAGRSDFRNQRFEPDMAKMRKMRKAPLTLQNKGFRRLTEKKRGKRGNCGKCGRKNAENAADWLNVTVFR